MQDMQKKKWCAKKNCVLFDNFAKNKGYAHSNVTELQIFVLHKSMGTYFQKKLFPNKYCEKICIYNHYNYRLVRVGH